MKNGELKVLHEVAEGKHRIVLLSQGDPKPGEWVSDLELAVNGQYLANLVKSNHLPLGVFIPRPISYQILD